MKYLLNRAKDLHTEYYYSKPSSLPQGYNIFTEEIEYENYCGDKKKQTFTFIEINSLEELEKFRNDVGGDIVIRHTNSEENGQLLDFETSDLIFEEITIYDDFIE